MRKPNSIHKVLLEFAVFAALLGAAYWTLISAGLHDSLAYFQIIKVKSQRAKELPAPRIVFAGGSATAYGIRSDLFEKAGWSPVNLGLNAGTGLDFILRSSVDACKPGDVLLLSLEYGLFFKGEGRNKVGIPKAFLVQPDLIRHTNGKDVVDGLSLALGDAARFGVRRIWTEKIKRRSMVGQEGDAAKWNSYGDREDNRTLDTKLAPNPPTLAGRSPDDEAYQELDRFIRKAQGKGIKVIYAFPMLESDYAAKSRDQIAACNARVSAILNKLGAPILYPYGEAVLPRDHFHDTYLHLNQRGLNYRMPLLFKSLKSAGIAPGRY